MFFFTVTLRDRVRKIALTLCRARAPRKAILHTLRRLHSRDCPHLPAEKHSSYGVQNRVRGPTTRHDVESDFAHAVGSHVICVMSRYRRPRIEGGCSFSPLRFFVTACAKSP